MKFSVQKNPLVEIIQIASKAVASRTTKNVLMGILLECSENRLTATAYDMELGIQTTLTSEEENKLNVEQPGSIVLPAKYLLEVVRKLPDGIVSLEVHNNYTTNIHAGQVDFHLHGIDSQEFPKLPIFHNAQSIELDSSDLRDLIRSTHFATSTSEVRPILTGIYLQSSSDKITFTATDGLRLGTKSVTFDTPQANEWEAILPAKSLTELLKLVPEDADSVSIQFTSSHSLFYLGQTLFYTRLIDGIYPDTSRIVPTAHKTEVILPLSPLLESIDRAALIARDRDNNMIRLEIQEQTLTISSNSPEIGNVSESLSAFSKTGEDLMIAFNAKYVLDALKAFNKDEISIYFNGSNQPFVLKEHDEDDALQLISPILMR